MAGCEVVSCALNEYTTRPERLSIVKTIIHVDKFETDEHGKYVFNHPPLKIISNGRSKRAKQVFIAGPSVVVFRPRKPLRDGARVWIETHSPVEIVV